MAIYNDVPYAAFVEYDAEIGAGKASVMKYDGSSWQVVGVRPVTSGNADHISISIDDSGTPYLGFKDANQMAEDGEEVNGGIEGAGKATVMKLND